MGFLSSFLDEWKARRRGRRYLSRDIGTAAREIVGPTGDMLSSGWEQLEANSKAYLRSFDPRVPPSLHVSSRDLTRANMPVPLVERCIEDWNESEVEADDG